MPLAVLDELGLSELLNELKPLDSPDELDPPESLGELELLDSLDEPEPLGSPEKLELSNSLEEYVCELLLLEITPFGSISIRTGVLSQPENSITAANAAAKSLNLFLILIISVKNRR